MAAFVATPPAPIETPPIADEVANDGWYPAVKISETRDILSLTMAVTDARLQDAIIGGMLSAAKELRAWRALKVAEGAATMAGAGAGDTDPDKVADGVRLVRLYGRATRAYAAAELVDKEGRLSATDGGRARADTEADPADSHRRLATHTIRDILGKARTKVRLI